MYKNAIPSFENLRLIAVFKKYADKKSGINPYGYYNEQVRTEKRDKDLHEILSQTKLDLKNLKDSMQSEIKSKLSDIDSIIFPHIVKDVSLSGEKTYGAVEFGNALEVYKSKPNDLSEILKTALAHKRNDFVFLTLDLFMKDKELSLSEKNKVQNIYDEISQQVGITEKKKQLEKAEQFSTETNNSLELIDASPQEFDSQVMNTFKVRERMKEAGQI
jgi:hypothetical protein